MKKNIEDFLNEEVKDFSISVIKERALPCVIDGWKPSQRKIIFTANKVAKQFMKTSSLAGYVSPISNYDKGDDSIPDTIARMIQEFSGSNNFPFLEGSGSFGSRFIPKGIAAPRYTKTKLHSNFERFFTDHEILSYTEQDEQIFEPDFYLPRIPTLLLNGPQGIAVGYACEFQPYNISDIVKNCLRVLHGKPMDKMLPFFEGFRGKVFEDSEGKIVQSGKLIVEKTGEFVITEVPTGTSREKYIEVLDGLIDKDIIFDYEDYCNRDGFHFIVAPNYDKVKTMTNDEIYKTFKLSRYLNENLNAISEYNRLLSFNNANEIIQYFVMHRLGVMVKRKKFHIKRLTEELTIHNEKIKFIKMILSGQLKLNFKTKKQMKKAIEKLKFKYVDKLMDIPIYSITEENVTKLTKEKSELTKVKKYFQEITEDALMEKELKGLL